MQTFLVTIPEFDLVDVKVEAGTPRHAAVTLLQKSMENGLILELQDEAEAIVINREHKKFVFDIATTPFCVRKQG